MTTPIPSIDQLQTLALPAPVSYMPQTWLVGLARDCADRPGGLGGTRLLAVAA